VDLLACIGKVLEVVLKHNTVLEISFVPSVTIKMGFGVLESASNATPRGTSLLESLQGDGKPEVILVPQPSSSPQNPLNLAKLRKELASLTIILGACATGVIGPLLVPGFGILAVSFSVTITDITITNGALVMALGVSSYLCSCFAAVYGKRLVFLFTMVLMVAACCWGAAANTYNLFLGARIMQGKSHIAQMIQRQHFLTRTQDLEWAASLL